MKRAFFLAAMAVAGLTIASPATSQGTPGCPGCMPKIQRIWDSTHVTPAPSFTTSASTGAVHIPPRIVEVVVPAPPPPPPLPTDTDQGFFSLPATFVCTYGDGFGERGARAAVLGWYKEIGGRCADSGGLEHFTTALWRCSTTNVGAALAETFTAAMHRAQACTVKDNITKDINTQADTDELNRLCRVAAQGQSRENWSAYKYVRGRNSDVCSRV